MSMRTSRALNDCRLSARSNAPGTTTRALTAPSRAIQPSGRTGGQASRPRLAGTRPLTFADFLRLGEFDRHLRRLRPVYRSRRDALVAALAQRLPTLRPVGVAAGLHLVALLPPGLDETKVVNAAAIHGVKVAGLAPYRLTPSAEGGLIFGYSNLPEATIRVGVELLAEAIDELCLRA